MPSQEIQPTRRTAGRRGPGRPATRHSPSRTFRLSEEFMANLDGWAARQKGHPTRSDAIRRLVEIGLKAKK